MENETKEHVDANSASQKNTGMKPLTIIGSLIGGAALIVAILIIADPFSLNLLARLRGDYDPTIRVMPLDTVAYVQLNILEANITELNNLGQTFQAAFPDSEDEETTLITEQAIAGMEITPNDILSWAGQFAGMGVLDVTLDEFNQVQDFQWLAAFEVRDEANAQAFVDTLSAEWERTREVAPTTQTVQETTVTVFTEKGREEDALFVTLNDGLLLVGSDLEAIESAIATQNGRSLAEDVAYQETIAQLTTDPFITAYVNDDRFYELMQTNIENNDLAMVQAEEEFAQWGEAVQGIGIRLSFADNGLLLEQAMPYNPELLTDEQKAQLNMSLANVEGMIARVPENAVMYMALPSMADFWQTMEPALLQTMDEVELEEALKSAEEQFGINPVTGLLAQLDGESMIVLQNVADAEEYSFEALPFTISALFGTSEADTLATNLDSFRTAFASEERGIGTATEVTEGDFTLYQLNTFFFPEASLFYTIHQDTLVLTSDTEGATELVWDGGTAVTTNAKYQKAETILGNAPFMFVDVEQLSQNPMFEDMPDDEIFDLVDHAAFSTSSSENVYNLKAVVVFTEATPAPETE